ncbi:tRNA (adenosine(37)-N6)-dimethylallyltransferase MiaA [Tautonia marina]|uniref:tRNA (adenosine(37)-N6)-dimethylallyltransferase MiaA n=1 Tax=Tautonia marina TaxID=2653855 RepID=UPI00126045E2|nr:tRNA (adenosine(37)-N6)-dimethylallyltransferase MiaA [Tautonia marina]
MPTTNPFHQAIYLTGPTASGKTSVGIALAERLNAEILALDSMTLYRGMDIGTAKPTEAERRGVPHHLIDVLDPWQSASVADYRSWAAEALADIASRNRTALFVGGTPMYLKALLRGLFDGPAADPELRQTLEDEADRLGNAALHARLAAVDPASASRLHPNDRRRIIRALEVFTLTGRPLSTLQHEHDQPAPASVPVVCLDRPRAELYDRINRRVASMFADGLIDEVRRLLAQPHPPHTVPMQGVGYREVLDLLSGRLPSEAAAIDLIQTRTRQFAKRQLTWFRSLSEVQFLPLSDPAPPDQTAERLLSLLP